METPPVTVAVTKETLAQLLRDAEQAHGAYETSLGRRDENWPDWYADFIVQRLAAAKDTT